jgi:deferrochelatase/peroxidase EfeB
VSQTAPTPATDPPAPNPPPAPSPVPVAPQPGITNRPPEHAIVAALALPGDAASAIAALAKLRAVETQELSSRLPAEDASTPKAQAGPETGEIGFADGFDRAFLTITTGFSSTAYDKLGISQASRPQDLVPIPWDKLGDAPVQPLEGDIVLQICSDDPYICEHVLHRVLYELSGQVSLVWAQVGVQRYSSREGRVNRAEGRALTGFIDGTANLDPNACDGTDDILIFVDPSACGTYPQLPPPSPAPAYGQPTPAAFPPDLRPPPSSEPAWTKFGSYMVVRSTVVNFDSWDTETLGTQEQSVGRFKFSRSFLDLADDPADLNSPPAFAANPQNVAVPLTAHVRKANPRGPSDDQRRIFRRGYPLINGSVTGLDRGLLFIAYGRTISTQFEFIFRAWMRNPNFPSNGAGVDALFGFEKQILCGGYYFVPPVTDSCDPASWLMPAD